MAQNAYVRAKGGELLAVADFAEFDMLDAGEHLHAPFSAAAIRLAVDRGHARARDVCAALAAADFMGASERVVDELVGLMPTMSPRQLLRCAGWRRAGGAWHGGPRGVSVDLLGRLFLNVPLGMLAAAVGERDPLLDELKEVTWVRVDTDADWAVCGASPGWKASRAIFTDHAQYGLVELGEETAYLGIQTLPVWMIMPGLARRLAPSFAPMPNLRTLRASGAWVCDILPPVSAPGAHLDVVVDGAVDAIRPATNADWLRADTVGLTVRSLDPAFLGFRDKVVALDVAHMDAEPAAFPRLASLSASLAVAARLLPALDAATVRRLSLHYNSVTLGGDAPPGDLRGYGDLDAVLVAFPCTVRLGRVAKLQVTGAQRIRCDWAGEVEAGGRVVARDVTGFRTGAAVAFTADGGVQGVVSWL